MYKRRSLVAFFIFTAIFLGTLATSEAALAASTPSREAQIKSLLEQIARLQAILNERKAAGTVAARDNAAQESYTIYETYYYGDDFESIYQVKDLALIRRDKDRGVRPIDVAIWDYFTDVIGDGEARKYVDELRIFNKPQSSIGAFVELRTRNKDQFWIVGINEDDFEANDDDTEEIYAPLFVHEYAHLLTFSDHKDLIEEFGERFWTAEDERHARKVSDFEGNDFDNALENYYAKNKHRFVSDYATSDKDEDFAETFTEFVFEDAPISTNTIRNQKIQFMYQQSVLLAARERIRDNLGLD